MARLPWALSEADGRQGQSGRWSEVEVRGQRSPCLPPRTAAFPAIGPSEGTLPPSRTSACFHGRFSAPLHGRHRWEEPPRAQVAFSEAQPSWDQVSEKVTWEPPRPSHPLSATDRTRIPERSLSCPKSLSK